MSLNIINSKNEEEEIKIQEKIFNFIDENKSFIFSSGAGSGKTYALAETLKYIIKKYGKKLIRHNQKIMCITYTNVAVKEVKKRLGNSNLVVVSTIHERIWELIKTYKKELLIIHTEKLKNEIELLEKDIEENAKFNAFNQLPTNEKDALKNLLLEEKSLFYENYNQPASKIKEVFHDKLDKFNILNNIANFKSYVGKIYKIENYKQCLKKINVGENKIVKYTSTYNNDALHRMAISHDTLLDYGLKIITKYHLLAQIIIDSFPYILIDEYQDTNEKVIKIMEQLYSRAKKIKKPFLLSYFGDTAQNIYDEGIGRDIFNLHKDLKIVKKDFNRRSFQEIIDVTNKIRNDEIQQKSIFSDCLGGTIQLFHSTKEDIDIENFISKIKNDLNISIENKLDCLILTNKLLAKYSGFENIYTCLTKSSYYKKNYEQIGAEIFSSDLTKLGAVPLLFYQIIDFISKVNNEKTLLKDILIYSNVSVSEVKEAVNLLCELSNESLYSFIINAFKFYGKTSNLVYKKIIENLFNNLKSFDEFYKEVTASLYNNINDEELNEAKKNIDELLNVGLKEYFNWFDLISSTNHKDISFQTYHSTKGLEFNNMLIIMQNDFGSRNRNFFSNFFSNYNKDVKEIENFEKFEKAQNLFYVACSRAIKNLRILYLDKIIDFEENIEKIFGKEGIKNIN